MSRQNREEQARPNRVSVAEQRNKLTVYGLDTANFYYRFVTDKDDRIARFLRAGYEFVSKEEAGEIGDPTVETSQGTDSRARRGVGGGRVGFLMKLPMEFYKHDQAAKEAELLETERAMRRSKKESQHAHAQDADIVDVKISSNQGRERVR